MERYAAQTYGDRIADVYDEQYESRGSDPEAGFLAGLAAGGPVLELGIGTGRVALPLAARGVAVHGIDASQRMVDRLRAKPGGDAIPVTIGDFSRFDLDETFTLVYVVFNTFFGVISQDEQVGCFECVARHLRPGGRFVLEVFVPDVSRFDRNQRTAATSIDVDELRLDASIHDPVDQRVHTHHVRIRDGDVRLFPVAIRYAYPAELDLMARVAGLEREARYGGWRGEPFGADCANHVSVYRRPE
jgi:SAM-dependent methyltransferase